MSFSLVVYDSVSHTQPGRKRSSLLTCPRHPDATPIPPTLLNSPHLSSSRSVFRRKPPLPRWPSQAEDEWLRDTVPLDRPLSDHDTKSDLASNDSTPSPTSSDSSFDRLLLPPSPLLRPRSADPDPDLPTSAKRALGGPGFGPSPHS